MTASSSRIFAFVTGALLASAIALAQQPAQSSTATSVATSSSSASQPAQKAAATKAPQAQPVKTASAQAATDPSPTFLRDAANAGLRPEHIRGTLMFCRTEKELGSNFPVKTCYNEEQTRTRIDEYQTQRNQLNGMRSTGTTGN